MVKGVPKARPSWASGDEEPLLYFYAGGGGAALGRLHKGGTRALCGSGKGGGEGGGSGEGEGLREVRRGPCKPGGAQEGIQASKQALGLRNGNF